MPDTAAQQTATIQLIDAAYTPAAAGTPPSVQENEFNRLFAFLQQTEAGETAANLQSYLARNAQDKNTKDAWLYVERTGANGQPEILGAINASVFASKKSGDEFDAKVMVNYLLTDKSLSAEDREAVEKALQENLSNYTKQVIVQATPEGDMAPRDPKILTAIEAPAPLAKSAAALSNYETKKGEPVTTTLDRRVKSGFRELAIPFREPEKSDLSLWIKTEGGEPNVQPSVASNEVTSFLQDWTGRAFPQGTTFDNTAGMHVTRDYLQALAEKQEKVQTLGTGRYAMVDVNALATRAKAAGKDTVALGEFDPQAPKLVYGTDPFLLAHSTDVYPTSASAEARKWVKIVGGGNQAVDSATPGLGTTERPFADVETSLKTALAQHTVEQEYPEKTTIALPVTDVQIVRHPRGAFAERGNVGPESLTIYATITNSDTLNPQGVDNAILSTLEEKLNAITVQDGEQTRTLASYSNYKNEPEKTHAEIVDQTKADIAAFIAKHPNAVNPAITKTLQEWHGYDNHDHSNTSVGNMNDKVQVSFYHYNNDDEKKSTSDVDPYALAKENIVARKGEILANIQKMVADLNTEHMKQPGATPLFTPEEFAKLADLDLVVSTQWGLNITIGGNALPLDATLPLSSKDPADLLKATPLAKLAPEHLNRIVKDSILLTGKDAELVAPILADRTDIHEILKTTSNLRPELAADLKPIIESDLFLDWKEREERDKNKPTPLSVHTQSEHALQPDIKSLTIPLPPGVAMLDVVRAMKDGSDKTVRVDQIKKAKIEAQQKDGNGHGFAQAIAI